MAEICISEMINAAKAVQLEISAYDQAKIDSIVRAIAKTVYDNAEELAKMAVDETGMGNLKDKIAKNQGKSRLIWNDLKTKKSIGVLREIEEEGIIEVAKPIGVIAAVTPCTNPVVTPMCNAMMAVKCANTIIVAPHPRAKKLTVYLKSLWDKQFEALGVPKDIIQVIPDPSLDLTNEVMQKADAVIATGGGSMVKAAYSSGKPSYGVGQGNVQCIFDRDLDIDVAVNETIAGRLFDNGIICAGEQTIIAHEDDYEVILAAFEKRGAYILKDESEIAKLRDTLFPQGKLFAGLVGKTPAEIAEKAGIVIPEGTKVIIVPMTVSGKEEYFSKEKMFPVMTAYKYKIWEEGVQIAKNNLDYEGKGHSLALRSNNKDNILYAAKTIDVSRVVVNQICSTSAGGAFKNGLNPTTTIGCGTWGNNSISENFTYYHMMNKIRISMVKPNWVQPSDEEIWS